MSATRKVIMSAAFGVIGAGGCGFFFAGIAGAAVGVVGFGIPAAIVGTFSECSYRMTKRFSKNNLVLPLLAAGTASFATGIVALKIMDTSSRAYNQSTALSYVSDSLKELSQLSSFTALPIGLFSVITTNLFVRDKLTALPESKATLQKKITSPTLASELCDGALIGFTAGGLAQFAVGFKEGPIGGMLGGLFDKTISFYLNKNGLAKIPAEVIATAITALLDVGGLHFFGRTENAPISYTSADDVAMHHKVFYSLLILGLTNLSRQHCPGFFHKAANEDKAMPSLALPTQELRLTRAKTI